MYLHRVCKAVHPDLSISKRAMDVLQSFTADMFERLVVEAARITTKSGQATLTSREVCSPAAEPRGAADPDFDKDASCACASERGLRGRGRTAHRCFDERLL